MLQFTNPADFAAPQGPYSHMCQVADGARWLYAAGQTGLLADGTVPGGIAAQAEIAWSNLATILAEAEMEVTDIVKYMTFLTDAADRPAYGEVRGKFLGAHRPTSTMPIVAGLARPEFVVEVELVAAKAA